MIKFKVLLFLFSVGFGFKKLNAHEVYSFGFELAKLAKKRPDIAHRFLLGFRDGMVKGGVYHCYGIGEILHSLWRQWFYRISQKNPPIPFRPLMEESGAGKI